MTIGLFTPSAAYKPFRYPWAYEAWKAHEVEMHWSFHEVPLGDDVKDWGNKLNDSERNLINQIFRLFTQADVEVENAYLDLYMPKFKPTEIRMMLSSFAAREAMHQASYSYLLDTLGMPETDYAAFREYKEMSDKCEYLKQFNMDTPHNTALSMAVFGAFTEGLQLFASFAILLNFPRFNKLKGMGQIVTWSIRDETCMSDDTEVLTEFGWKLFKDLDRSEKLAQFSGFENSITFAHPTHYTQKPYTGEMIHIHRDLGAIDILCTPDHDLIFRYTNPETKKDRIEKRVAEKLPKGTYYNLPTSGHIATGGSTLSPHERFLVALQADGTIHSPERYSGEICGCLPVGFFLKKDRKVNRLKEILEETGYEYSVVADKNKGGFKFRVKVPKDLLITKMFPEWGVNFSEVSHEWAMSFIEEISEWDGHKIDGGRVHYSSVVKQNALFVQTLASMCGWRAFYSVAQDNRKDTYQDVHRVHLNPDAEWTRLGTIKKDRVEYDGMVYCATMPEGSLVTRRNGAVGFVGNCHVQSVIKLFHTLLSEDHSIDQEQLKTDIRSACSEIVHNEYAFIDKCFEMGDVEGMTSNQSKAFVRFVADMRLKQLGCEPLYNEPENPLPWFDEMTNAIEQANFFESRSTEYTRGATQGDWDDDVFS